jgi:hypothetical protein
MYKILAPGIVLFENVFNKDYINFIEINLSDFFELKINNRNGSIVRKSYAIQLSDYPDNDDARLIYDEFQRAIKETTETYKSLYNINTMIPDSSQQDLSGMAVVTLLKYEIDNSIIFHSDTLNGEDFRIGAALAYLNDDYSGGELEFEHFNIKIKPPKNSLIIFPSNWPYSHRSNPIISGNKYALRCFLTSK